VGPMMPVANSGLRPVAITPLAFLPESRLELRAMNALA
jgi:hypothetical protein